MENEKELLVAIEHLKARNMSMRAFISCSIRKVFLYIFFLEEEV